MIKPGIYRHYKGIDCQVLGVAKHSETMEEMVVYYHNNELWVRPLAMFLENVEVDGKVMPRFKFLK